MSRFVRQLFFYINDLKAGEERTLVNARRVHMIKVNLVNTCGHEKMFA